MTAENVMWEIDDENEPAKIKKQRSRIKLSLAQKVRVINLYEHTWSLRRLAVKFKCGRTQIKGILRNRNDHLRTYEEYSKQKEEGRIPSSDSHQADTIEIVLTEWVKRARCYEINITDDILRNFAQEISHHVGRDQFKPTNEWVKDFKQKHSSYFMKQENIQKDNRKPLSISVIINDLRDEFGKDFIRNQDKKKKQISPKKKIMAKIEPKTKPVKIVPIGKHVEHSLKQEQDFTMPKGDDEGFMRNEFDSPHGPQEVRELRNYKDALNHLGPLEQFLLLQENIRGVALVNQLENLFREEI